MPASSSVTAKQIKDVNTAYHDDAAAGYDAKWGIDYGPVGRRQVEAKLAKALGGLPATPFADALEIGAGTGYFTLNLLQGGLIARATATDISPGMLGQLASSANRLGLEVHRVRTDAETLPFEDRSFDLVFGHAVLHHIPGLDRALAEFARVLRPGGAIAFCGEPSRYGERLASAPKRAALLAAPLWRRLLGASEHHHEPVEGGWRDKREWEVDVHSFAPGELRARLAAAGFERVRIRGEELLASLHGWLARTLESTADPPTVPVAWRRFAFRSYLALQRLDTALLEPRLPPQLFYNLVLSAHRGAGV